MSNGYAVIGGGIVGTSVAYHLSERTDAPVTVYERGAIGSETTDASMAMLGRSGDPLMARMKSYAMAVYNGFMADPVGSPAFHPTGSASVATTREGAASLADRADGEDGSGRDGDGQDGDGPRSEPVGYYEGDDIHSAMIFPTLDAGGVEGLLHEPAKGYATSRELAREFAARAEERGAEISEGAEVEDVLVEDGRVEGLVVADVGDGASRRVDAGRVVCAAGPWNVEVARSAGIDLPVRHSLAPILELDPPEPAPHTIPYTKHHESGIYVRSTTRGTVLVGRHATESGPFEEVERYDPDDVGSGVPASFRTEVAEAIDAFFPWLDDAEEIDERTAVGSRTPDGWPVLGWTGVEGFAVAAFHSQGVQLAPAAGRIIARQLVDGEPTEYYDAVSISRFPDHDDGRAL